MIPYPPLAYFNSVTTSEILIRSASSDHLLRQRALTQSQAGTALDQYSLKICCQN